MEETSPFEKQVIEFLAANGIDERASEAVLSTSPEIQEYVVARGDLSAARNPSAAVLGRIREAQKLIDAQQTEESVVADDAPTEEELSAFFIENAIDEKAQTILMSSSPAVQRAVLTRGSLADARNPSSALLGRIRDANNNVGRGGPRGTPQQLLEQVEAFIIANEVDDRAAEALQTAAPEVQQAVIDRGDLSGTTNPSSALCGRVRDAAKLVRGGGGGCGAIGAPMGKGGVAQSVEKFIANNGLDENAAEALRQCSFQVQQTVISRGSLNGTHNPSSALTGRIRDAKATVGSQGGDMFANMMGMMGMQGGGSGVKPSELTKFINENGLDERAEEALRTCRPEVQRAVVDRGSLAATSNPSAALLGRLRDAQSGGGLGGGDMFANMMGTMGMQGGASGVKPNELMKFITENGLDERASEALMTCRPEVQRAVVDRGSLAATSNPSAALLGRLRDAQSGGGLGKSGGGSGGGMDMANMMSMMMSMLGGMGKGGGRGGGAGKIRGRGGGGPTEAEVIAFIEENGIDERGSTALLELSPDLQQEIMARGSLLDARNPGAALMGRIRDAQKGVRFSPY